MKTNEIGCYVAARADWNRSAWGRGVTEYARDILDVAEDLPEGLDKNSLRSLLLNGAESWNQYSQYGCSLCCGTDIAERLCTKSELKKVRGGEREPNSRESWLQVQSRALCQAFGKVWIAYCNLGQNGLF